MLIKRIKKTTMCLLIGLLLFSSQGGYVNAMSRNDVNIPKDGEMSIEISDEQLKELREYRPENTPISDSEIDEYLIENGYATREKINKINSEIDKENLKELGGISLKGGKKYIDGYNKYRTFKKNGKTHLYLYISGTTLRKIYKGVDAAGVIASIVPTSWGSIIVQIASYLITSSMDEMGTKYGVVLCFVKDKWVHQGATYTYRYDHWFWQT